MGGISEYGVHWRVGEAITKVTWDTARTNRPGDTGMSNRTDGAEFASKADMPGHTMRTHSACRSYRATRSNRAVRTAWTNSARLAGRPNRSHLTGGSTWASKAAGANFPTDTGSAGRANGANVARETNSARFTGSTDCALGTSFAGVACTPSGTVAALRAGEASRTDNAAGALRTDGTRSAGLTNVTREPDKTLRTFGADYTGKADVTCRSSVACVAFEAAIPLRTRNAFGSNGPWRPSRPSWAGETSWAKCSARANGTHGARCTILAILAIVSIDTFRSS